MCGLLLLGGALRARITLNRLQSLFELDLAPVRL